MIPVKEKGWNSIIEDCNMRDYDFIPSIKVYGEERIITCWELSDKEVKDIVKNKKLYILGDLTLDNILPSIRPSSTIDEWYEMIIIKKK